MTLARSLSPVCLAAALVAACGGGTVDATPPGGDAAGGAGAGGTGPGAGGATLDDLTVPPAASCPATVTPCAPTLLDEGVPGPGSFRVQDGYLYWRNIPATGIGTDRDPNSVLRLRLPDGEPEVIADVDPGRVTTIVLDATHVYFGDSERGVGRVALAGGPAEIVAAVPAYMVQVDATHVYFSEAAATGVAINRIPKAGGEVEAIATAASRVLFALDETHVYWILPADGTNVLMRGPKAGGEAEVLSNVVPDKPERIAIFDDFVYVVVNVPLPTTGPRGLLERYPVAGGPLVELVAADVPIGSFAIDATSFYFGTCPGVAGEATVQKLSHDGTTSVAIAAGGVCYAGVTVDAARAYFADWGMAEYTANGNGQVLAADKCGCP